MKIQSLGDIGEVATNRPRTRGGVVNWAFRYSFLVILVTAISLTTCGDTSEMLEFVHCGLSNKSAGGYFGSRLPSIR